MNTAGWSTESGYSPVRNSSFTCDAMVNYLNSKQTGEKGLIQQSVKLYSELPSRYYVSPAFPGSSTCRKEVDGILANVFEGTKDLNQAFADAYAKADFAIQ